ncbi:hypothetical protein Tco_0534367 [Tanacetum coccineum]
MAPSFSQIVRIKELKAQSQAKDPLTYVKLKEQIKSLKGNGEDTGSHHQAKYQNDRIRQNPSSNLKNKVEAHPRNVKSSLNRKNGAVTVKGSAVVQNLKKQDNSDSVCVNSFQISSELGFRLLNHSTGDQLLQAPHNFDSKFWVQLKFENDQVCKDQWVLETISIGNVNISRSLLR